MTEELKQKVELLKLVHWRTTANVATNTTILHEAIEFLFAAKQAQLREHIDLLSSDISGNPPPDYHKPAAAPKTGGRTRGRSRKKPQAPEAAIHKIPA